MCKNYFFLSFLLLNAVLFSSLSDSYAQENLLPVTGSMRTRVDFWKKVYTDISSDEAFLHDSKELRLIYRKLELTQGSRRRRIRYIRKERRKIKHALRSLASKKGKKLSKYEQSIHSIVGDRSPSEYRAMARRIRFQRGLSDRYYKGLIRSYRYLDYIKKVFARHGLPDELIYLPHVESSFNYRAYSKVGAAGMWQFMRGTAKMFGLQMSYIVDERRDPIKATVAAAKLLKNNFNALNSWPLAITAYNHGRRSMTRAIQNVGSTNINEIIKKYKGRRFGFASKNFYATFMATVEVSKNPEKYFKSFKKPKPFRYSVLRLKRAYTVNELVKVLGIKKRTLQYYNPSIRPMAFRSPLFLPENFDLKISPSSHEKKEKYLSSLRSIKRDESHLKVSRSHVVHRGESLFAISKAYRVPMRDIIYVNRLSNPSRIYPGMTLKIPGDEAMVVAEKKLSKSKIKEVLAITEKEVESENISFRIPLKEEYIPTLENLDLEQLYFQTYALNQVEKLITSVSESYSEKEPTLTAEQKVVTSEKRKNEHIGLDHYHLELKKLASQVYQVQVEPEETLGHYADWAGVITQSLRRLNRRRYGDPISIGQKLKILIPEGRLAEFKLKRAEYHLSLQEDFFDSYKVIGTDEYLVKRGDYLNSILNKHSLPMWLLRKFQKSPDMISQSLFIGQSIQIPILEAKEGASPIYSELGN